MGLDYNFHLQKRTSEGWIVPADLTNAIGRSMEFAWIGGKDLRSRLFIGEQSLFPIQRSHPPEVESIELFQRHPDAFSEWFCGWLPFEELMLDYWDETYLLINKSVEAKYVPLFGDGQQPFPRQELLAAGLDESSVGSLETSLNWIYDTSKIDVEPIDYSQGKGRFLLEGVPSHYQVRVTWKVAVSSFMGERLTEAFRAMRQYGYDEEMRILCYLS